MMGVPIGGPLIRACTVSTIALAVALLAAPGASAQERPVALVGATIIPIAGEPIENGTLDLDGTWVPAIVNYTLYRCYSKDAEYVANANLAVAYYQAFNAQMTARTAAEQAADVNRNSAGTNPNVRGGG